MLTVNSRYKNCIDTTFLIIRLCSIASFSPSNEPTNKCTNNVRQQFVKGVSANVAAFLPHHIIRHGPRQ